MIKNDNFDLRMICLNYSMPTKGQGKYMNRESFRKNVIHNPEFNAQMASGKLFGMFTHKGRYFENMDKNIPYVDNIALNPYTANTLVNLSEDGDKVIVDLKLLDDSYKGARAVRSLLKNNVEVGCSMSTFCDNSISNEYHIVKLLGVDFTMDPAFLGTGLVEKNFSMEAFSGKLNENDPYINVNFSNNHCDIIDNRLDRYPVWQIPFDVNGYRSLDNLQNYFSTVVEYDALMLDRENLTFSTDIPFEQYTEIAATSPQNFSLLKQLLIEANYPPYRRLGRRIEELVREVRGKSPEYIAKNKETFFSFINDPIYNWIVRAFNSDKKIMLSIGLRLSKFCKKPSVIAEADRKLESIKRKRKAQKGMFDKQTQKELNVVMRNIFNEIWNYIEDKSNTVLLEEDSVKGIINNFANNPSLSFKTVDAWLDAGSDGQKDYMAWIDAFPHNAKDVEEYKKSKNFYGYNEVDKLMLAVANKAISQKDKERLVEIMKQSNVNSKNFDAFNNDPNGTQPNPEETEDLTGRSLTDADLDAFAERILSDDSLMDKFTLKLQERGILPGAPTPEGDMNMDPNGAPMDPNDSNGMPPMDDPNAIPPMDGGVSPADPNSIPQTDGGIPPVDPNGMPPPDMAGQPSMYPQDMGVPPVQPMNPSQVAQPPMEGQVPPQVIDNKFPKPKVISRDEASRLVGMSFSDMVRYSEADRLNPSVKRKLISFSVIELIDPNATAQDLEDVYFCVGKPNGLSREDVIDTVALKSQYYSGNISEGEYNNLKGQLIAQIIK